MGKKKEPKTYYKTVRVRSDGGRVSAIVQDYKMLRYSTEEWATDPLYDGIGIFIWTSRLSATRLASEISESSSVKTEVWEIEAKQVLDASPRSLLRHIARHMKNLYNNDPKCVEPVFLDVNPNDPYDRDAVHNMAVAGKVRLSRRVWPNEEVKV